MTQPDPHQYPGPPSVPPATYYTPPPPPEPKKRHRRKIWIIAGIVGVAAIIGIATSCGDNSKKPDSGRNVAPPVSTSAPAALSPHSDAAYLKQLRLDPTGAFKTVDDQTLISLGHSTCDALARGATAEDLRKAAADSNLTAADADWLESAAVTAYCYNHTLPTTTPKPSTKPKPKPSEPSFTVEQEQAIGSARQYLEFSGFSRSGLIKQLSSQYGEGFSQADATFAVDHLNVNWNEQAVRSAKQYLEFSHFSRSGLIEQLSSQYGEGYTVAQATYAADHVGLTS